MQTTLVLVYIIMCITLQVSSFSTNAASCDSPGGHMGGGATGTGSFSITLKKSDGTTATTYTGGQTYKVSIQRTSAFQGFLIQSSTSATTRGTAFVGEFINLPPDTTVGCGPTGSPTKAEKGALAQALALGQGQGVTEIQSDWVAPAGGTGTVYFHLIGVVSSSQWFGKTTPIVVTLPEGNTTPPGGGAVGCKGRPDGVPCNDGYVKTEGDMCSNENCIGRPLCGQYQSAATCTQMIFCAFNAQTSKCEDKPLPDDKCNAFSGDAANCANQLGCVYSQVMTKCITSPDKCAAYDNTGCQQHTDCDWVTSTKRCGVKMKKHGCWEHSSSEFKDSNIVTITQLTVQKCIDACTSNMFRFAALQSGNKCLCGNSYGEVGSTGKKADSQCATPCTGDAQSTCGGASLNYIYSTGYSYQSLVEKIFSGLQTGNVALSLYPFSSKISVYFPHATNPSKRMFGPDSGAAILMKYFSEWASLFSFQWTTIKYEEVEGGSSSGKSKVIVLSTATVKAQPLVSRHLVSPSTLLRDIQHMRLRSVYIFEVNEESNEITAFYEYFEACDVLKLLTSLPLTQQFWSMSLLKSMFDKATSTAGGQGNTMTYPARQQTARTSKETDIGGTFLTSMSKKNTSLFESLWSAQSPKIEYWNNGLTVGIPNKSTTSCYTKYMFETCFETTELSNALIVLTEEESTGKYVVWIMANTNFKPKTINYTMNAPILIALMIDSNDKISRMIQVGGGSVMDAHQIQESSCRQCSPDGTLSARINQLIKPPTSSTSNLICPFSDYTFRTSAAWFQQTCNNQNFIDSCLAPWHQSCTVELEWDSPRLPQVKMVEKLAQWRLL